jgi:hypothetical protein
MKTPDVELTEMTDLDPDTLHLVKRGANGFPALLAKSLAGEVKTARSDLKLPRDVLDQVEAQRRYRRNKAHKQRVHSADVRTPEKREAVKTAQQTQETNVKPKKSKKRQSFSLSRTSVRKSQVQQEREVFIAGAGDAVLSHIGELERQLAKSGPGQASWGVAYLLHRERARLGRFCKGAASIDDYAAVASYIDGGDSSPHPARTERQRATAATARAVAGVVDNSVHMVPFMSAPRSVLADVRDGRGSPTTMNTNDLPSLVEIHRLEKALSDAKTPQAREVAGYQLTRARLVHGHRMGEI